MTSTYPEDAPGVPEPQGGDSREALARAGETVKAEAAHFAEAARDKAAGKLEGGQAAVSGALGDFAEVIRRAADDLGERDQGFAARMVAQAAEGLQSFSRTIADKRPEEMLHAVRDFGRANPTAFVAGAVLAGLAIGRFARSSAQHEHGASSAHGAADLDPGVPLDTYETPGVADPYAADLASGFEEPARADAAGLEDMGLSPPEGEPSPDAGLAPDPTIRREI